MVWVVLDSMHLNIQEILWSQLGRAPASMCEALGSVSTFSLYTRTHRAQLQWLLNKQLEFTLLKCGSRELSTQCFAAQYSRAGRNEPRVSPELSLLFRSTGKLVICPSSVLCSFCPLWSPSRSGNSRSCVSSPLGWPPALESSGALNSCWGEGGSHPESRGLAWDPFL